MKTRAAMSLAVVLLAVIGALAQQGGELRFAIGAEPKTFNPLAVGDDSSEVVRYLTGGVLLRVNRVSQQLQPELAVSWKVLDGGRKVSFKLREGVRFSDGTPFTADDVVYTFQLLTDPSLKSPTGDSFRSGSGSLTATTDGPLRVTIAFPAPIAGVERLFDQVAIMSHRSDKKEMAVLGPFYVADHKPGAYLLLQRNHNYWKTDEHGKRLPYLDAVRLEVQSNRDVELMRFRHNELHLITRLDPQLFEQLASENQLAVRDLGASLEGEQMWFNQVEAAPIPAHRKAWFRSQQFRRAVSETINRRDLARIVFQGHATPGVGPVSPSNRFWFNSSLKPHLFAPAQALKRLESEGFRMNGGVLRDREGNEVEFSIITNAGNKSRERMAAMIQQDLKQIGIKLNIVTLDFPSLIERITRTYDYEACLLGLVNVDLDPNAQMNVWLSSGTHHQWNPGQKTPATAWEAEIDRLMQAQASSVDAKKRKGYFDRVQEIVWEQAPFLYLVNKNALIAVSSNVKNVEPSVLRPQTYWNVERLYLAGEAAARR